MDLKLNKDTVLCMSLSGRPGNFGTRFQNYLYQKMNLNFVYKAFTTNDLPAAIAGIRALGIRGCAVSMPFKEACIPLVDEMDDSARGIMAVNTIVNNGGRLKAYNTDYSAVVELIRSEEISKESTFALRGSGGMAKAVACALRDLGFKRGSVIARNENSGSALAQTYGFHWKPQLHEPSDFLINTTPIGMAGGPESGDLAFSQEFLESAQAVFDVVAVPSETPLVKQARKLGKKLITGANVIVLQAVEQFVLYTGLRPPLPLIEEAAKFAQA